MADEKNSGGGQYRDMLDIIFANRNKAYGAYSLRREYPKYLGRALMFGVALIIFMFALPAILSAVEGLRPKEKPVEIDMTLAAPPDINPNEPPPPPPPPPPTPPPPARATVRFVPPVLDVTKKDETDPPPPPPPDAPAESGKKTVEGTTDVPTDLPEENYDGPATSQAAPAPETVYNIFDIQKQPSFPGGEAELFKYLAENIKYPALARENNLQGVVSLSFVVNKDGGISDVTILKDPVGGGCGKEAVRVVGSMPKWSPGEANGNPVKVRYTLPVRFRLE
jgi:periplasmic protein TonB